MISWENDFSLTLNSISKRNVFKMFLLNIQSNELVFGEVFTFQPLQWNWWISETYFLFIRHILIHTYARAQKHYRNILFKAARQITFFRMFNLNGEHNVERKFRFRFKKFNIVNSSQRLQIVNIYFARYYPQVMSSLGLRYNSLSFFSLFSFSAHPRLNPQPSTLNPQHSTLNPQPRGWKTPRQRPLWRRAEDQTTVCPEPNRTNSEPISAPSANWIGPSTGEGRVCYNLLGISLRQRSYLFAV